jgi:hypothetical protein
MRIRNGVSSFLEKMVPTMSQMALGDFGCATKKNFREMSFLILILSLRLRNDTFFGGSENGATIAELVGATNRAFKFKLKSGINVICDNSLLGRTATTTL